MALDEIKKLRPEERIKRLKELEEERKKEIEEAEKIVKDSKAEIEDELLKKMHPPEAEEIAVEELFKPKPADIEEEIPRRAEPEEQEVDLETVAEEAPKPPEQEIAQQAAYQINQLEDAFRGKTTQDIYANVKDLMQKPAEQMSAYEKHKAEAAYHIMEERKDLYGDSAGQKIGGAANAIMGLSERITQDYRG